MSSNNDRNQQQRRKTNVRRPAPSSAKGLDIWKPVPQPPDVVKITATRHPDTLLGSLGDPPLGMKSVIAGHYLATVIERSAILASALAASADLLNTADPD
jgi:hypothetical protein